MKTKAHKSKTAANGALSFKTDRDVVSDGESQDYGDSDGESSSRSSEEEKGLGSFGLKKSYRPESKVIDYDDIEL